MVNYEGSGASAGEHGGRGANGGGFISCVPLPSLTFYNPYLFFSLLSQPLGAIRK